jgi:hypothetical protein
MTFARWGHRLRRVFAITAIERRDLVWAQWYLLVARWRRAVSPKGRYLDLSASADAATVARAHALDPATRALAARLALAVERAAAHGLIRPTCLERATALERLLQRRGIAAGRIRVGVRLQGEELLAHAWVELGGTVLADSPKHVRAFRSIAESRAGT